MSNGPTICQVGLQSSYFVQYLIRLKVSPQRNMSKFEHNIRAMNSFQAYWLIITQQTNSQNLGNIIAVVIVPQKWCYGSC